jgi:hypothetical protein
MENPKPKAGTADASFCASEIIEGRSALILAKVALQVLSDLDPEASASIDDALTQQIVAAQAETDTSSLTLAALLEDVRTRLRAEEDRLVDAAAPWLID